MPNLSTGISVILCTFNGADRLPKTLEHLVLQKIPSYLKCEVIVVDNASNDDSKKVANSFLIRFSQNNISYSVIDQPLAGLTYARQTGIENSQYEYIVFCDDDNWLQTDYLKNAHSIIESNPKIGALGGMSIASSDNFPLPEWFSAVESWYAVGKQANIQGDISHTYNIWGAGMVTRKTLFQECHPKDFPTLLSGRQGLVLSAGEDTEFCLRLLLMGYALHYSETLRFTHFIQGNRLTPQYRDGLRKGFQKSHLETIKYYQFYQIRSKNWFGQLIYLLRILIGYSSTLFGRNSWKKADVIRALYYISEIDLGVEHNSKKIYLHYT